MAAKRYDILRCSCRTGQPEYVPSMIAATEFNGQNCGCEAFNEGVGKGVKVGAKHATFIFRKYGE